MQCHEGLHPGFVDVPALAKGPWFCHIPSRKQNTGLQASLALVSFYPSATFVKNCFVVHASSCIKICRGQSAQWKKHLVRQELGNSSIPKFCTALRIEIRCCAVFLGTFLLNIHVFDQMLQACCHPPLPPCGLPPVWWGDAPIHLVPDDTERSTGGLGTARESCSQYLLLFWG